MRSAVSSSRLGDAERLLLGRDLVLQAPALGGMRIAGRGVELLLAGFLVLVALAVALVERRAERIRPSIEGDRAVDVGREMARPAALDDLVAAVFEQARIEHARREAHAVTAAMKPDRADATSRTKLHDIRREGMTRMRFRN